MQLNNLHHIPPGFFCPLKNLAHIELSSNAISDLNHLGISHSSKEEHQEFQCKLHTAKSLHLRNNGLVAVTPLSLAAMPSLKHLDLSHNHIGKYHIPFFENNLHILEVCKHSTNCCLFARYLPTYLCIFAYYWPMNIKSAGMCII